MVINPIVGVYIPIIRIPIKGGMTIPNIGSLDPGTYKVCPVLVATSGFATSRVLEKVNQTYYPKWWFFMVIYYDTQ